MCPSAATVLAHTHTPHFKVTSKDAYLTIVVSQCQSPVFHLMSFVLQVCVQVCVRSWQEEMQCVLQDVVSSDLSLEGSITHSRQHHTGVHLRRKAKSGDTLTSAGLSAELHHHQLRGSLVNLEAGLSYLDDNR